MDTADSEAREVSGLVRWDWMGWRAIVYAFRTFLHEVASSPEHSNSGNPLLIQQFTRRSDNDDIVRPECAAFPIGAHDDQVDAWSQGSKRLLSVRQPSAPCDVYLLDP